MAIGREIECTGPLEAERATVGNFARAWQLFDPQSRGDRWALAVDGERVFMLELHDAHRGAFREMAVN
jgi:hypothetical protein